MPVFRSPFSRYLATATGTACAFLALVAAGNVWMDPLWCFGTRHALNERTRGFDERQQKTNRLAFLRPEFDAVLIGTSRSAFIDQRDLPGVSAFNYAAGGMAVSEMPAFLTFARQRAPKGLRHVYVGLDFDGTARPIRMASPPMPASFYLDRVADPAYRLKAALSWEALTHGFEDLHPDPRWDMYDRENRKHHRPMDDRMLVARTNQSARVFRRHFGASYVYDPAYGEQLEAIKASAAGSRLHVFTTPVSAVLLEVLHQEGRLGDYRRWLRQLVATFGEVDHFMTVNGVTRDFRQFVDGHHLRPAAGRMLARRLMDAPTPAAPPDFGVRLTTGNLDHYLANDRNLVSWPP